MCCANYVQCKGVNMPHPCSMAVVVSYAGLTDALPPALPYTKFPRLPITWGRASPITFTYCVLCYPTPHLIDYRCRHTEELLGPPHPQAPEVIRVTCGARRGARAKCGKCGVHGAGCRMRAVCIMCCVL